MDITVVSTATVAMTSELVKLYFRISLSDNKGHYFPFIP